MGRDHEAPVALERADVVEAPHPQPGVRHVEQQRVLALDRGLDPGDQQDAQALGPPAQLLGVDALVVAREGEDVEALTSRLLQQLHRRVADEVVRVFAGVDVEVRLQEHCPSPNDEHPV